MRTYTILVTLALASASCAFTQNTKLRVIAFGAHPDDAEIRAGGVAAKFAAKGHMVKFVSVTNGDAGHCEMGGGALAKRRRAEAQQAARHLGIAEYEVFDNHDGELVPSLEVRKQVIRAIRLWNAEIVLSPRPYDYHPDHRYTSILVQDAAFMVQIPMVVTDAPPLKRNPVFLYFEDGFRKPQPFAPDIAIDVDDVWQKKLDAYDAEPSQFYEAQPKCWGGGIEVPTHPAERRRWLENRRSAPLTPEVRSVLQRWYGPERAGKTAHAEAFELCEYGRRASAAELKKLFPFFD
ncbi:MAG: PIG-L family deacetylase [Acidobacteriales bacterium]|nr:PIG-L family deacetylase [Terriglobales bacterium]